MQELLGRENFKTYEELKTKLDRVLGLVEDPATSFNTSDFETREAPVPVTAETVSADGDETLSYFANLANDQ